MSTLHTTDAASEGSAPTHPAFVAMLLRDSADCNEYVEGVHALGGICRFIKVLECWQINTEALNKLVPRLSSYSGIVITSQRAAQILDTALTTLDVKPPEHMPLFAVGSKSHKVLSKHGFNILGEGTKNASELASTICESWDTGLRSKPMLFLKGDKAMDSIPAALSSARISFEELAIYETRELPLEDICRRAQAAIEEECRRAGCDLPVYLLCCSPSGTAALRNITLSMENTSNIHILAIGTTTEGALAAAGLHVDRTLPSPTAAGLVQALRECLTESCIEGR